MFRHLSQCQMHWTATPCPAFSSGLVQRSEAAGSRVSNSIADGWNYVWSHLSWDRVRRKGYVFRTNDCFDLFWPAHGADITLHLFYAREMWRTLCELSFLKCLRAWEMLNEHFADKLKCYLGSWNSLCIHVSKRKCRAGGSTMRVRLGSVFNRGSASGCQGFRRNRPKLPGTKFATTLLCGCNNTTVSQVYRKK